MAAAGRRRRCCAQNNVLDGYLLPNEADLRQVTVLSKAEWERIQGSTREAAHDEKKEQKEVGSKPDEKDGPNAPMSLTQQKLLAKALREEKEEEERKLLDLEEAQFQAAKRKEVIENAKTYLRYQDDKMRQLHSALLLAKVLKERDAQVEFQNSKLIDSKKEDYEEEQRLFKEYILSEQEKAHQHFMKQRALHKDQLEQIKEHEHQADLAKQEHKREEEELERSIQLYKLEVQRKKEKKEEEKAERQRQYREYVKDKKILKAIEEQKQMEEDDRVNAHFRAKEIIDRMRKNKEAEMRRLVQERQDKVATLLAEQKGKVLNMEGEQLARQIAKIEADEEKKREEKEAKQKAAIESIAEYRASVIKMKEEKERQEKAEAEKERDVLMENDRIYLEMENTKKQGRHEESVKVQKFQIQQMAEKKARKQKEKQAELDYDAQKETLALCKEHEFQKYAKQVVESESKTNHRLYPLHKACKDWNIGPFF